MKQFSLRPSDQGVASITMEETSTPTPGAGEVLVKMSACSLNYRDLLMKSGKSASSGGEAVVPLSDGAGVIEAVGAGVSDWSIGDRVALTFFRDWEAGRFSMKHHKAARGGSCDGVLSEFVVAPQHSLVRVPGYLSFEEAATLPCAAVTAWHAMMERGKPIGQGDTVLCLGTGGVSIFALQIAKAAGARVLITSSSEEKLARAKELGADATINYRTTPEWDKEVFALTDGEGADYVIEVGGPGTLEKSMNSAAAGGTISLIGVLTGFAAPEASLFPLVARNIDLQGIYVGNRAMFESMLQFFEEHQIRPVIDSVYSFEEALEAYAHLESAKHLGKIVIEM